MARIAYFRLTAIVALVGGSAACLGDPSPEPPRPLKEQATLVGHEDVPQWLVFSPDSKTLASAGRNDETVRLWSMRTFKDTFTFKAPMSKEDLGRGTFVHAVAFSPNGKTVAMNSAERTIQLWDTSTGKLLDTLKCRSPAGIVLFSPDGKTLATDVDDQRFWNLDTKTSRATSLKLSSILVTMVYDPKGKLLLAIRDSPDILAFCIWDVEKGKKLLTCKKHTKMIDCLAFSRDAKFVVTGSEDHTVRIWDAATGKNTATFEKHPGRVICVAFSPDGKVLASGYRDPDVNWRSPGFVRLTEVATGKVLSTLKGHEHSIQCLAFSPDGKWLASGANDRKIKVWSLPSTWEGVK